MVSETLSRAETEFRQGNFEAASTLFAEAVANFDYAEGETKDLASLLQKLADSEYALNKYDEARQAYSRLVSLHETEKFSNKDKVSALLKLAKSSEKCHAPQEAEKNYQSAYEIASLLSAKHFLRRTVLDGYCDFLRTSKRNEKLLTELEEELGIKKEDKHDSTEAVAEVTPDSIPTPISPRPAGEQEFFVLRSRLTKFSRKKEAAPEIEDKSETVLSKKTDKTIEQEVAERKFLRGKGEAKDRPEESKSRRSKLRSAMTQAPRRPDGESRTNEPDRTEGGAVVPDLQKSGAEAANPAAENSAQVRADVDFAPGTDVARISSAEIARIDADSTDPDAPVRARNIDAESLPQDLYPSATASQVDAGLPSSSLPYEVDYSVPERNLAKFVGRRPKRTLRDTSSSITSIAAPSLAVEPVSMPDATRSFLQQSDAIKKASDEDVVAPDVVPLRAEGRVETIVPTSQKVATSLRFAAPLLALLIVAVAAIAFIFSIATTKHAVTVPAFIVELAGQKFVTADGSLSIILQRKSATLGGSIGREAPLKYWTGDWRDELALLQGVYKNCKWLVVTPSGLKDENGATFYKLDAPERKVTAFAKQVSEAALEYYKANNKFPSYSADLPQGSSSYQNPFTGKTSSLSICSAVDNKNTKPIEGGGSKLDQDLQNGGSFKGEALSFPGAVYAYSVSGQPQFSDDQNAYQWATQCFYIHAFDRNNKMIGGNEKGKVFLIALKNGFPVRPPAQDLFTDYGAADIGITETAPPKSNDIAGKYMAIFGIIVLVIGLCVLGQIASRMRMRRRK